MAREAHRRPAPRALDGEVDVDAAVHLVHLAADPGDLVLEVDVVAEDGARAGVGAQCVQRRRDNRRRRLLVVEHGEGADGDDGEEDGQAAAPAEADLRDFCRKTSLSSLPVLKKKGGGGGAREERTWKLAVGSPRHQRAVMGFGGGSDPSSLDGVSARGW